MGLAPQIVEEIFEIVSDLNQQGARVASCSPSRTPTVALRYADYGYILENGRVVMDGDGARARAERGREGVLPRPVDGGAQELPRREALSPPQALAGMIDAIARSAMRAALDVDVRTSLETSLEPRRSDRRRAHMTSITTRSRRAIPSCASASSSRSCAPDRARQGARAGVRAHRSPTSIRAAITTREALAAAAGHAQVRARASCSKRARPFGGLAATRWGSGRGASSRRPGRSTSPKARRPTTGGSRARCSPPAFAPATSSTTASPTTSRRPARCSKPARTRSAARCFPAAPGRPSSRSRRSPTAAGRLRRHAVVPAHHPREGRRARRRRCRASRRRCVSAEAFPPSLRDALIARGIARLPGLCHRRPRRDRLRDAARARAWSSTKACWSRSCARHRRPGRAGRSRRGRRHDALNADYPLIRFGTGDLSAVLPGASSVRPHQPAHQGLAGPRRPDDEGEGHVRASGAGRGDRQAASRGAARAARRRQSGGQRPDDAACRSLAASRRRSPKRSSSRSAK